MRARILLGGIIALSLTLLPSCADKARSKPWRGRIEIVEGVTVISNPKPPMHGLGALELAEELSFGEAQGSKASAFYQAWYVAVNDAGEMFVMDQADSCVKVFSPDGTYVRSLGRRGQGPGELQNPNTVHLISDGRLVFEDFYRGLVIFGPNGIFMDFLPATGFVDVLVTPSGRIVARANTVADDRPAKEIRVFDGALRQQAAFRLVPEEPRDPQVVKPYAGGFHWTLLGEDALAISEGNRYALDVFSLDGRPLRRILKDHDPIKISRDEIDRVEKNLRGRTAEFPPAHAAVRGMWADDEGNLIIGTYERSADGRSLNYDVFDRDGRCLVKLAIPENVRPQVWKGGKMYGLEEDAEGNQRVKICRLVWRVAH